MVKNAPNKNIRPLALRKVGVNMVFGSRKHEIALWAARLRRCHQGDFFLKHCKLLWSVGSKLVNPLVVHPGGVGPLRNIMKSSVPRLLNPNCKNEIWGVQPHMLRKEKIISHPTEGFAKIKMRFQK